MNLRELAESDNALLLEDDISGFAVAVKLTDPGGPEYEVKGQYHRVGVDIDPETGAVVQGNKSAVTVRLSSLGPGVMPADSWKVETTDITGAAVTGYVNAVMADRTAGRVTMLLRM